MTEKYETLSSQQALDLFKKTSKKDTHHSFNEKYITILSQELSFTSGWSKIIIEDYSSVPFQSKSYMVNGDDIRPFIYSSTPFLDNDLGCLSLNLDENTIQDYLEFYLDLLLVGSDILVPVLKSDDIEWHNEPTPSVKQGLDRDFINYPQIKRDNDNFMVKIPCLFQQSVMIITFFIMCDGQVEIKDKQCLIDDLPLKNFA